jgi:3-deoxy-D-manno-octulosonate 8-phosphate phosphatase (KDO 8-P phosphatase)
VASVKISAAVRKRAKRIEMLLLDVDGVLTDGCIYLQSFPDGSVHEMKVFYATDGVGLKLLHNLGIKTGVITGRKSSATMRRAREANMDFVFQGQATKSAAFEEALQKAGLTAEQAAYMGDDLPDIPVLERAGLAIAVANAMPEVKSAAHYVTRRRGGDGAVREVIELILKSQNRWRQAVPQALA